MNVKKNLKFTRSIEIKCIIFKQVEGDKKEWLKHVQRWQEKKHGEGEKNNQNKIIKFKYISNCKLTNVQVKRSSDWINK